jgi:hypothetical protein
MAGDYVCACSSKLARKKLMKIKPKTKKLTYMSRAPALDNKLCHNGNKAYYYIFDKKR